MGHISEIQPKFFTTKSCLIFTCAFQIWDFQSGRSRDCEESGPEDSGCINGKNNTGFVSKNYDDGEGGSSSKTKVFQDTNEMSHSMRCEDTLSRNVSCFF